MAESSKLSLLLQIGMLLKLKTFWLILKDIDYAYLTTIPFNLKELRLALVRSNRPLSRLGVELKYRALNGTATISLKFSSIAAVILIWLLPEYLYLLHN